MRFFNRGYLVDKYGCVDKVSTYEDLKNLMLEDNLMIFIDSLTDDFPYLDQSVRDDKSKVICSKNGNAIAVRMKFGNKSRWIVQAKSWNNSVCSTEFLSDIEDFYSYVNIGVFPTPSSLGTNLMRNIHYLEKLKRITCLSLSAEDYLHKHSFGGVVHTPGIGNYYDELSKLDESSAWLSKWAIHKPVGSACFFRNGYCDAFSTYFGRCEIEVKYELPLGPFPVRTERNMHHVYPTLPGKYETYLWKEQVEDCIRDGCVVRPLDGIGWFDMSDYGKYWSSYAYWLRKGSPTDAIEGFMKSCIVSAIGHHNMSRVRYYLKHGDDVERQSNARPLIKKGGDPLNYFVVEERDNTSAILVHHNSYTIMACNREVYNFALPFASSGRLVAVDYDSILALPDEQSDRRFVRRYSIESLRVPPGTWLLEDLYRVTITAPRSYVSLYSRKQPGVKR